MSKGTDLGFYPPRFYNDFISAYDLMASLAEVDSSAYGLGPGEHGMCANLTVCIDNGWLEPKDEHSGPTTDPAHPNVFLVTEAGKQIGRDAISYAVDEQSVKAA